MRRILRISVALWMASAAFGQVPKAADGHPDLSGIWQTLATANWDLEDHAPEPGPFYQLGALGGVPPGRDVVEGGHSTTALATALRMRSYMGEPRGHWEGDTLVVETRNFIGGRLAVSGSPYSEDLTLVEHFRRTGPQTLEYSVTVNDPRTYTAPWTATFPLTSEPGYQIFEYACHEGNYAMRNRLSAARAEEAREVAPKK